MYPMESTVTRPGAGSRGTQRGFFDAGLGLALLALFSVTAAFIAAHAPDQPEPVPSERSSALTSPDAAGG